MRFEIRTLSRVISTLALLFVLVVGASLEASAQGNSRWARRHNRGNHYGWTRGRRVGQQGNTNWLRTRRRENRREIRSDRRELRSDRRELRQDRRENRRENRHDNHDNH
jgi:hypothetical protein